MKVELRIKNLPAQKSPRLYGFISEFYGRLKTKVNDNLYQNLTNNGIEGTHSKSFHEASTTLIPKQDKNKTRTKA